MKLQKIPQKEILLPGYILDCIKKISWMQSDEETITFYPDDFIVIMYGVRGSTAYSDPDHIRYGSNTTSYQFFSPKLPSNHLYLGDGGSGIIEPSQLVIQKCFQNGINPFGKNVNTEKVIKAINNLYTHYHYDHLHTGAPLAGVFHANNIQKNIIGGDNPEKRFTNTFKRPDFPRDFAEIKAAYKFQNIDDPRSAVIVFLPDGDYKIIESSKFENYLSDKIPQIKHKGVYFNIENCIIVKCYPTFHPDPTISYRYENYNSKGELINAFTFMTDHDMREVDSKDSYFKDHVSGASLVYFDGQYSANNYIPSFGHGRVEVIGQNAADLDLEHVLIGHHDPSRKDDEIDQMIEMSRRSALIKKLNLMTRIYQEDGSLKPENEIAALIEKAKDAYKTENKKEPVATKFIGASDRMMIFIPSKDRGRKGKVYGRMSLQKGSDIPDDIGFQSSVVGLYTAFDLTQLYQVEDLTVEN